MSKIRERLIGAGATIAIAGGVFWAVAAANADEAPEPEPTSNVTVAPNVTPEPTVTPEPVVTPEPTPTVVPVPVVETPPADIPVEPIVEQPAPAPAPAADAPPGDINIGPPPVWDPPSDVQP